MKNIAGKIGKFLTEQKQHKQRVILFACLTVLVLYGTVTGLKLYGQAMNHRRDVLECQFELHKHDEDCLDVNRELICGYADFVVHEHDELCYDWNGKLVCTLQEYDHDKHDEACYEEVRTLICEEEEADDAAAVPETAGRELTCDKEEHTHSEACYSGGKACEKEAHAHSEACETRTLTCSEAEHTHDASCQSSTLTCAEAEHTHGEGCYNEEGAVICGQNEHAHGDGCYTTQTVCGQNEHSHNDGCYNVEITCGKEEHEHDAVCSGDAELTCGVEEHVHSDDCWTGGAEAAGGDAQTEEGHVHDDDCYITEVILTCDKLELHEHDKNEDLEKNECFDKDGNWICGVWELLEHQHNAGCLVTKELSPEEIADIGEQEQHLHTEECYDEDGELICEYPAAHGHKDWCYDEDGELICGYETEEHVHVDKCFDEDGNVICGYEGARHLHDATCYDRNGDLACGYGSFYHKHEEECYDEEGNLICGYLEEEEHVHTEDCYDEDGNLICGYGDSDDEAVIELRTEVEGITIILSGPASSFEPDKEYSITAELVWQEETLAAIDDAMASLEETYTAVMPAAEGSEADAEDAEDAVEGKDADNAENEEEVEVTRKVQGYYAFDIKLWADGVEVEPIGPVTVRFEGGAVEEAANDEETVSMVLHVDGETGDMTDMEAVEEDGAMTFETDHFSIYVYVHLKDLFGKLNLTVEHWGENITVVDGTAVATDKDNAFETGTNPHVKTTTQNCEIYSTDVLDAPNEYYEDIRRLSKVYNASLDDNGIEIEGRMNYTITKVWVSTNMDNKDKETWTDYKEYTINEIPKLDLTDDKYIIRFWYTPKKDNNQFSTPANFYDYDITGGTVYTGLARTKGGYRLRQSPVTGAEIMYPDANVLVPILEEKSCSDGIWYKINYFGTTGWMRYDGFFNDAVPTYKTYKFVMSEEQGINASGNFTSDSTANRMGVGQEASGNLSSWSTEAKGTVGSCKDKFLNKFNSGQNAVVKGLVGDTLVGGQLQYNATVPKTGFFAPGIGCTAYTEKYELRFKKDGDTYTLQSVYNTQSGEDVTGDLTQFSRYTGYSDGRTFSAVYSNNFWPMDGEQGADPHMGASLKQYRFLDNSWKELERKDAPNPSDDSKAHNWHFGMTYEVKFKVGDYTGPMEFYFRGDDDLWLFIDGKLAVDIGGIHSSVGETLDIRTWMQNNELLNKDNKNAEHSMKIFYMERGGFGSCCYMQFTLPNSEPVTMPKLPVTEYSVWKSWKDGDAAFRPENIKVELTQILNGKETPTGVFVDLNEDNGWKYTWTDLPLYNGASQNKYTYSYKIQEVKVPGYISSLKENVLTNTLQSTSVSVEKKWEGDESVKDTYQPGEVLVQLYCRAKDSKDSEGNEAPFVPYIDLAKQPKVLTLSAANGWSGTFDNLPIYMNYRETIKDGKKAYEADKVEYMVFEVYKDEDGNYVPYQEGDKADGKAGSGAKYEVSYSVERAPDDAPDDKIFTKVTITNRLTTQVKIVKVGIDPTTGDKILTEPVEGAEFSLVPYDIEAGTTNSGTVYIGTADEKGNVLWAEGTVGEDGTITPKDPAGALTEYVPEGTWLLSEAKAPTNYVLNEDKWIVTVDPEHNRSTVHKYGTEGNTAVDLGGSEPSKEDGTVVLSFYYYDTLTLYELPKTGGVGTAWYTFAGALAVLASLACFTYRKRRTAR